MHFTNSDRPIRSASASLRLIAVCTVLLVGIVSFAQPANDNPCGATALPVNASCVNTAGTVNGATGSGVAAPTCGNGNNDVWYTVVVPASGSLTLTTTAGTLTNAGMAVYTVGACATPASFTQIACNDDQGGGNNMPAITLTCQTAGATLYVRVWKQSGGGGARTFNICAVNPNYTAATNDSPCTATSIAVNASCVTTSGTNVCATATGVTNPTCAGYAGGDVWFSFVVPASGSLTIRTDVVSGSPLTDDGLAIYTASACGTLGSFTQLACDDNSGPGNMGEITLTCQTAGATLYARVWENGNDASGPFTICAIDPGFSPATNDEPCTAIALPVNASCVTTSGTNVCATASGVTNATCAGYSGGDVWFSFVVPASGSVTVRTDVVSGSALTDGGLAIYSASACGTPGSFTQLACDDNSGPGSMGEIILTCQTAGATLYARVWENGNNAAGPFTICVIDANLPAAANDDPCSATNLTVNATCTSVTATNYCATSTGVAAPGCSNYAGGDVWFKFTVPASGAFTVRTDVVSGSSFTDSGMSVYSATACGTFGSFVEVSCDDDSGPGFMSEITSTCATSGSIIYVRVFEYGNNAAGSFSICVFDPGAGAPPPANDTPCSATLLTVGTTCSTTASTNVAACYSPGIPAPGCGNFGFGSRDVWFKFVAPASGAVSIETTAGTMTDGAMALYSATACGGTFNAIECDDNDGPGAMPLLSNFMLTPGDTYYIRFWGNGTATGTFNICVSSPALATGTCTYSLEMYDSGNDGWGTSSVGISINGGAFTNYTVAAGYNWVNFGLNIGDILAVQYTSTGPNQNQNQYWIRQIPGGQGIYVSGRSPASGIVYTETADCYPPNAIPEDCSGGVTICNGQSFSNNTAHTGFDPDLAGDNFGCLASGERQGTWYHFSPSAPGTIGFTIAPNAGSDDYDFAVWGPYADISCPPPSQPLRCSYSGSTGNTGVGNGATDVSEDGGGDKWVSTFDVLVGEVYSLYISNFSQSGLAFSLSWQFTNGASLDCSVLPVELLSFTAEPQGEAIALEWATATELDNSHFIVERSADSEVFQPIAQVNGAGNTTQEMHYTLLDEQPMAGVNYYRLKQVDLDGTAEYSDVVSTVYRAQGSNPIVFPNPASGDVGLAFDVNFDGLQVMRVSDARGRVVLEQQVHMERGQRSVLLPTMALDRGAYSISITDAGGSTRTTSRFVKL